MNKKGISDVIAAVLLILIIVVAIMILWLAIIPLLDVSYDMAKLEILKGQYTVFDPQQRLAGVQLRRWVDEANLAGLQFVFYMDSGDTITYYSKKFPLPNEGTIYYFSFCKDGISGTPTKVGVAPIFKKGFNKLGDIISTADLKSGDLEFTYGGATDIFYNVLDKNDYPILNRTVLEKTVSYWRFDEDGFDDYDINNGTTGGDTTFETGLFGSCNGINFGNGGFVASNETNDNQMSQNEGTISFWFKRDGYHPGVRNYLFAMFNWTCWCNQCNGPSTSVVCCPMGVTGDSCRINCQANGIPYETENIYNRIYIYFNGDNNGLGAVMGGGWHDSLVQVPLNEWHMATLVWNATSSNLLDGGYTFYLDGEPVASYTYTNLFMTDVIRWGSWADVPGPDSSGSSVVQNDISKAWNEYFNGTLDEAIILKERLSDQEVQDLFLMYNNSRSG